MMWFVILHVVLVFIAAVLWGIRQAASPIKWNNNMKQYAQVMVVVFPLMFIVLVLPFLVAHWLGGEE